MAVVQWVPHLEGVDGVRVSVLDLLADLCGGVSVLVEAVVELDVDVEVHFGSRYQESALSVDSLDLSVLLRSSSEHSR